MCELHRVLWFDGEQLGENNPNLRQRETGMGVQKVYHKKDYGIFLHSDTSTTTQHMLLLVLSREQVIYMLHVSNSFSAYLPNISANVKWCPVSWQMVVTGSSYLFLNLPEVRLRKRQSSTSSRRLRCWRHMEWTLIHARWSLQITFLL